VSRLDDHTRFALAEVFRKLCRSADSIPRDLRDKLEDEVSAVLGQLGGETPESR
jgi:hypothetical protein